MKRKNVVVGEKYILKGNREDWHYSFGMVRINPSKAGYFNKKDVVKVVSYCVDDSDDVVVCSESNAESIKLIIDCKFLKKIKGDK